MKTISNTLTLYSALKEQGFELPEECVDVKLVMNIDSPFQLEYLCNATDETLVKIGRALESIGKRSVK